MNCHLHFDHCGGNPSLPGTPIIVQQAELRAARTGGLVLLIGGGLSMVAYRVMKRIARLPAESRVLR